MEIYAILIVWKMEIVFTADRSYHKDHIFLFRLKTIHLSIEKEYNV